MPKSFEADAIVVGAGPAGSTASRYLADQGLRVLLLEKSSFPRDKICGDGLTPRCTKQLIKLGIDISDWHKNWGLRVYGGKIEPFELPWPELAEFPSYGLTKPRLELDEILARHAQAGGADLREGVTVQGAITNANGRIIGVRAKDGTEYRAPFVIAADGNSSRLGVSMGRQKMDNRPMGVAVRTYYRSPRSFDSHMESYLELRDANGGLLPGYGWIFPLGDGRVNLGLGQLNTTKSFQQTNYRNLLKEWVAGLPEEWQINPDTQEVAVGSAALPMCFNRQPAYADGLLLLGDAAGMVSPFNGEGIAYALEAGSWAAEAVASAHYRGKDTTSAEKALHGYATRLKDEWGGYFRIGQGFAKLIGNPKIMQFCTTYGLPRPTVMRFTMKLLAHLYDTHDGDWIDRVITSFSKVVPDA